MHIPTWALVHLPVAVTLSTSWFTRKGWLYSVFYVLFENAMGTVKLWAVVTGAAAWEAGGREAGVGGSFCARACASMRA